MPFSDGYGCDAATCELWSEFGCQHTHYIWNNSGYMCIRVDPQMHVQQENNNATVVDEVDPELLAKVLANSEMRALLNSLAKTMK